VPGATQVETPAVTRLGNWEVAVSFDPVLCEISCVYRVRTDRYGRTPVADLLLPPAIDLRVTFGEGSTTFTIDPAHTRDSRVGMQGIVLEDATALPASHASREPLWMACSIPRATTTPQPVTPGVPRVTPLPLRV
jgi:hypothetical protein